MFLLLNSNESIVFPTLLPLSFPFLLYYVPLHSLSRFQSMLSIPTIGAIKSHRFVGRFLFEEARKNFISI